MQNTTTFCALVRMIQNPFQVIHFDLVGSTKLAHAHITRPAIIGVDELSGSFRYLSSNTKEHRALCLATEYTYWCEAHNLSWLKTSLEALNTSLICELGFLPMIILNIEIYSFIIPLSCLILIILDFTLPYRYILI